MNLSIATADDDRHACLRLKDLLQDHCNLDTLFFQTKSVLAEKKFLAKSIDLLLLDIDMPQMSGLELCRILKKKAF